MEIMLTDRQRKILNLIVREYSKKNEPVASKEFSQKFFSDLSPATIRREFFDLTKEGYLLQPHTSAGRIPTDKAYKLFVDEVLENEQKLVGNSEHWQKKIEKTADVNKDLFLQSAKMIADFCDGFGMSYSSENGLAYTSGIMNLFGQLMDDVSSPEMKQIFKDIETMDENFDDFFDIFSDSQRNIFIGKDNPITKSDNLSIISRRIPEKKQSVLVLIGSKHMNYDKNLAILEAVANMFE
jgi:heat-inducible transcriptional repressor